MGVGGVVGNATDVASVVVGGPAACVGVSIAVVADNTLVGVTWLVLAKVADGTEFVGVSVVCVPLHPNAQIARNKARESRHPIIGLVQFGFVKASISFHQRSTADCPTAGNSRQSTNY